MLKGNVPSAYAWKDAWGLLSERCSLRAGARMFEKKHSKAKAAEGRATKRRRGKERRGKERLEEPSEAAPSGWGAWAQASAASAPVELLELWLGYGRSCLACSGTPQVGRR